MKRLLFTPLFLTLLLAGCGGSNETKLEPWEETVEYMGYQMEPECINKIEDDLDEKVSTLQVNYWPTMESSALVMLQIEYKYSKGIDRAACHFSSSATLTRFKNNLNTNYSY